MRNFEKVYIESLEIRKDQKGSFIVFSSQDIELEIEFKEENVEMLYKIFKKMKKELKK